MLEYLDDSSKEDLREATIYRDSAEITYQFKNFIRIGPSCDIDFRNIPDSLILEKQVRQFQVRDGVLQVVSHRSVNGDDKTGSDTASYKIGNHSLFWWSIFGR
jgi:hypothetical protein